MQLGRRSVTLRESGTKPSALPGTTILRKAPCRHATWSSKREVITRATKGPEVDDKTKAPEKAPAPNKPHTPKDAPPKPDMEPRAFLEVAFDKALDSVLDISRHVGRQLKGLPTSKLGVAKTGGKLLLQRKTARPVVLILGSGWAAHSCIKVIDTDMYDVVLVSPRNFFMFTPMLPSTAVGTVEFRSLLEPIRTSNEFVSYLEASCDHLDLQNKVATCTAASAYRDDGHRPTFEVPYDILVVTVGEQPATFGVPGVAEHCCFMKEISDTIGIRNEIGECFELAALPGTTDEERQRLLHFVVVGGGPTGVEFAGTLSDYVRSDLRKKFPELMEFVKVSLLQSAQSILTQFDSKLAKSAVENLSRTGVTVRTGVRVVEVTARQVVLKDGERLDYGLCVWSCGNAARPLVQTLVSEIPEQAAHQKGAVTSNKLAVDRYMRVLGAKDTLALGDCSLLVDNPLPSTAQVAAQQGAYAAHMVNRSFVLGTGGLDRAPPARPDRGLLALLPLPLPLPGPAKDASAGGNLNSYDEVSTLVARPETKVQYYKRPFEFLSLGIMAYVGDDKALTQIEAGDSSLNLYGGFAYLLWRSVYITKQVSLRNRVLILFDWLKTKLFGRDLSNL